jgi:hypothetical protein
MTIPFLAMILNRKYVYITMSTLLINITSLKQYALPNNVLDITFHSLYWIDFDKITLSCPDCTLPPGKGPLDKRLGGPQSQSGCRG